MNEPHAVGYAGLHGVVERVAQVKHVDLDAYPARAVLDRRCDRNPTVPGAEVVDDIVRRHLREIEHRIDDVLGRRNVRNVGRPDMGRLRVRDRSRDAAADNNRERVTQRRKPRKLLRHYCIEQFTDPTRVIARTGPCRRVHLLPEFSLASHWMSRAFTKCLDERPRTPES